MVLAQDYLLSAICPARIPTRNTSCNDVGGATRSVAAGICHFIRASGENEKYHSFPGKCREMRLSTS
jgi:hypothetical protein